MEELGDFEAQLPPELVAAFNESPKSTPVKFLETENKLLCRRCGAVVAHAGLRTHRRWHRALSLHFFSLAWAVNAFSGLDDELDHTP